MAPSDDPDLKSLGTPENCVADFCLIPVHRSFQLRHYVFRSNPTADRNPNSISVAGGGRSSTLDAEERFDLFDAFRRDVSDEIIVAR